MRYKYKLELFYLNQHRPEGIKVCPAALFIENIEGTSEFSPKLTEIHAFETADELLNWLKGTGLLNPDQLLTISKGFRSRDAAQMEMILISRADAAKQTPPLIPVPGEVVPSQESIDKLNAWEADSKK